MPQRPSVLDWITRLFLLVCAGMVTLSIIGAIAAIPAGSGPGERLGLGKTHVGTEVPDEVSHAQPEPRPDRPQDIVPPEAMATGEQVVPGPAEREDKAARWLESIAYALMALCGLLAIGLLLLWQIVRELARRP